MSAQEAIREISEPSSESAVLTALRRDFWKKEFQLELDLQPAFSEDLKKTSRALLLDEKTGSSLVAAATSVRTEVKESQFADALILQESKWWLYGFLADALSILMVKKAPALNTHRRGYITGDNAFSMMAAVTAIKMGFENIVFVVENPEFMSDKVEALKKRFFDLNVTVIPDSELTLQPSNGSLLINTVTEMTSKMMVEDLTYLNFIEKQGSLIVEIPFSKSLNAVLEEAEHAKMSYLASAELWGFRDYLLLKSLHLVKEMTPEQYLEKWNAFLNSTPIENTPKVQ